MEVNTMSAYKKARFQLAARAAIQIVSIPAMFAAMIAAAVLFG
jgi:hypothetical protein